MSVVPTGFPKKEKDLRIRDAVTVVGDGDLGAFAGRENIDIDLCGPGAA